MEYGMEYGMIECSSCTLSLPELVKRGSPQCLNPNPTNALTPTPTPFHEVYCAQYALLTKKIITLSLQARNLR